MSLEWCDPDHSTLLEIDFPIDEVSEACAREKSIRQGHLSTLQQWWARRPLGVCRAAIFAALCPTPDQMTAAPSLVRLLDEAIPGPEDPGDKLIAFTGKLSHWEAAGDPHLLRTARSLLMADRTRAPVVADTFAGGGSIPVEALRLGLGAYAADLNPVAVTALRAALEYLPGSGDNIVRRYHEIALSLTDRIDGATRHLYSERSDERVLAFFWCRTYCCPACGFNVPLLQNHWLAKGKQKAVNLIPDAETKRFRFEIYAPVSGQDKRTADQGTVNQTTAICPHCRHKVTTKWLREQAESGGIKEALYAKLVVDKAGKRAYVAASPTDARLAESCSLRLLHSRKHTQVPSEPFDLNGIRHTWMIQYGIKTTADLYSHRQGIALLEVLNELEDVRRELTATLEDRAMVETLLTLLMLTFNRLVMYGTRHAWWQPNGEFPANMFVRQAIPMVWNYVEMPVNSIGAAGWKSAATWLEKVLVHLASLPTPGIVHQGDAAASSMESQSVDLVAIDPPYYDSIAYSYLADTFYVWMKAFLGDLFPNEFVSPLSPKAEEAIVDRRHRLALHPKTDKHFRNKMTQALIEARRVLKPQGKLLIMFGHKKVHAWDALLGSVIEAGFLPRVSWPVHTERKVKFRHGRIDALSSSCLILCVPAEVRQKQLVTWKQFVPVLNSQLAASLARFQSAHFLGSDLATALIAPACALLGSYDVTMEDGTRLSIGELVERLPELARSAELTAIMTQPGLRDYPALLAALESLVLDSNASESAIGASATPHTWLDIDATHPIIEAAIRHARALHDGDTETADAIWGALSVDDRDLFRQFIRGVTIVSSKESIARQLALATISRISLQVRTSAPEHKRPVQLALGIVPISGRNPDTA